MQTTAWSKKNTRPYCFLHIMYILYNLVKLLNQMYDRLRTSSTDISLNVT